MAKPRWHIFPTLIILLIYAIFYLPLIIAGKSILISLLIIIFGIFIDIDHLDPRCIKQILHGNFYPKQGWINYMHTWQALICIGILCFLLSNYLPLISYIIHIAIDGGNRACRDHPNSPLQVFLHRLYPQWLTYDFRP